MFHLRHCILQRFPKGRNATRECSVKMYCMVCEGRSLEKCGRWFKKLENVINNNGNIVKITEGKKNFYFVLLTF